ncbi:hypothetical protein CP532_3374 [Ophiocordyceps camponoti-leonardi (nom. inval.)]|nr:hypothetical protein CP532_3374 [Ophiocordyceps camponoti-leonardi (nom. inval.)]
MKLGLLISIASVVLALTDQHESEGEGFQERFERNSQIDTAKPPYFNSSQAVSKPCSRVRTYSWPLGGRNFCPTIHYWVEEELIPETANIMATPEISIEADVTANESALLFNTSRTTVIFNHKAAGWSLNVEPKGHDLGSIFTRGRKPQPKAHIQKETIEQTTEYSCPAWHQCQIQVVSWHATVLGKCKSTAKFACTQELRICDQKREHLRCDAYQKYHDQHCHGTVARDCGFKVPLFGKSGMPKSEIRLSTRDRRPHFTGCFKGYPWATLSNGEIYNPVDDLYFVHSSRPSGWYSKDRSQPPPQMPREFPCPRRQSMEAKFVLNNCTDVDCQEFRDENMAM